MKTSQTKSGKKCRDRSAESCLRTSSVSEWRLQELVLILHLAGDGFCLFAVFLANDIFQRYENNILSGKILPEKRENVENKIWQNCNYTNFSRSAVMHMLAQFKNNFTHNLKVAHPSLLKQINKINCKFTSEEDQDNVINKEIKQFCKTWAHPNICILNDDLQ